MFEVLGLLTNPNSSQAFEFRLFAVFSLKSRLLYFKKDSAQLLNSKQSEESSKCKGELEELNFITDKY